MTEAEANPQIDARPDPRGRYITLEGRRHCRPSAASTDHSRSTTCAAALAHLARRVARLARPIRRVASSRAAGLVHAGPLSPPSPLGDGACEDDETPPLSGSGMLSPARSRSSPALIRLRHWFLSARAVSAPDQFRIHVMRVHPQPRMPQPRATAGHCAGQVLAARARTRKRVDKVYRARA